MSCCSTESKKEVAGTSVGASGECSPSFVRPTYNRMMVALTVPNVEKALAWYQTVLGVTERGVRTLSPDKQFVMHAEFQIGEIVVMIGDMPAPPHIECGPRTASLYLYVPDPDAVFATALQHGATTVMAVVDMFYGDRMGMFKDPFGNQWMVAKPLDKKPEDIAKAAEVAAKSNVECEDSKLQEAKTQVIPVNNPAAELASWKKMNRVHYQKQAERQPKKVVSNAEWYTVMQHHLNVEKALSRHRDLVTSLRQQLPWTEISNYALEDLNNHTVHLSDLFVDPKHDELIVYHLMLPDSDHDNRACNMCSFWVDNYNGIQKILQQKVNLAIIAKGSPEIIIPFAKHRGWTLPIYSAHLSTLQEDLGFIIPSKDAEQYAELVKNSSNNYTEALKKMREINPKHPNVLYNFGDGMPDPCRFCPGLSVFHVDRKEKKIYRTFAVMGRGLDLINAGFHLMDLLPWGREGFIPKHLDAKV